MTKLDILNVWPGIERQRSQAIKMAQIAVISAMSAAKVSAIRQQTGVPVANKGIAIANIAIDCAVAISNVLR